MDCKCCQCIKAMDSKRTFTIMCICILLILFTWHKEGEHLQCRGKIMVPKHRKVNLNIDGLGENAVVSQITGENVSLKGNCQMYGL